MSRSRLACAAVILLTLVMAGSATAGVVEKQLVLSVNQQELIDARNVKSYSLGDRDLTEVRLA